MSGRVCLGFCRLSEEFVRQQKRAVEVLFCLSLLCGILAGMAENSTRRPSVITRIHVRFVLAAPLNAQGPRSVSLGPSSREYLRFVAFQ